MVRPSHHVASHRAPQLRVHLAPAAAAATQTLATDEHTHHARVWHSRFEAKTARASLCQFAGLTSQVGAGRTVTLSGLEAVSKSVEHREACWLELVLHLANQPDVAYIEGRPEAKTHNYYAAAISQQGSWNDEGHNFWDEGIDGEGEVIGIADTGLDDRSCFFRDDAHGNVTRTPNGTTDWVIETNQRKVITYVAHVDGKDELDGHGTHVVGSALGKCKGDWRQHQADNTSTAYYYGKELDYYVNQGYFDMPDHLTPSETRGMAPGAKVSFYDIGDEHGYLYTPSSLSKQLFPATFEAGGRIHSDSWGTTYNGVLSDDIEIDEYSYKHKEFVVLIAAGNDGQDGFYTTGSPAVSKNCIAVGASENGPNRTTYDDLYVASFSSLGPTYDGRFKPDLTAPGDAIISARSHGYNGTTKTCDTTMMSGTSMATPVTAGNTALLRHYFRAGRYKTRAQKMLSRCYDYSSPSVCEAAYASANATVPSGAMLKALLITAATPMNAFNYDQTDNGSIALPYAGSAPPDFFQGFGRVSLDRLLHRDIFLDDQPMNNGSLASEVSISYTFEVTDDNRDLVVTLVWMDPPTTTSAAKQLVHDLDLMMTLPDGSTKTGNAGGMTWSDDGVSDDGQDELDELNNVERILVAEPDLGNYTVTVRANSLVYDEQAFAFVITGKIVVWNTTRGLFIDDDEKDEDDDGMATWLFWTIVACSVVGCLALLAGACFFFKYAFVSAEDAGKTAEMTQNPVVHE